ncbi:winged helix-turn-helix domain-containing protein [Eisenbergiella sp.]
MEITGLGPPVIEAQYNPDRTILILPFVQKQLSQENNGSRIQGEPINEPINDPINDPINLTGNEKILLEKRIIDILLMNSNISQPQMAEIIGVSLSSAKRTVKKVVESG